jgi:hypothetical protein
MQQITIQYPYVARDNEAEPKNTEEAQCQASKRWYATGKGFQYDS